MAVKLRLKRMGKKRQPIYKVVAADVRSPRDGKFIEAIGLYNPRTEPTTVEIDEERALYWLGVGAQPTETVKHLLSRNGILLKKELTKKGLSEEQIETELENWKKLHADKKPAAKKEVKKEEAKEVTKEVTKEETKEVKKTEEKLEKDTEVKDTASEEKTAEEEKKVKE